MAVFTYSGGISLLWSKAQIYRYEAVHESMQGILNSQVIIGDLPIDKTPINLLDYKVKKSNVEQYGQLTGGDSK